MIITSRHRQLTLFFACVLFACLLFIPPSRAESKLSITYFGDLSCNTCVVKEQVVQDFAAQHPEVQVTYNTAAYGSDPNAIHSLQQYFAQFGIQDPSVPAVVLNNSGQINILFTTQTNDQITPENLNAWINGTLVLGAVPPLNFWLVLLSGIIAGGTPCVLLIMSLVGTSLVAVESRGRYLAISIGLILGLISAYVIISVIFIAFVQLVTIFTYFKYIFGGILLVVGLWQIVDFRNEKSVIFGTPTKVKDFLRNLVDKRSGGAAFLLGIIFAFVKIPCSGGIYLSILFTVRDNPLLFYYVLTYFAGMILPVVILLIAMRLGLQSDRVNAFRMKNRAYLRLASGILLIALTIYLIFS